MSEFYGVWCHNPFMRCWVVGKADMTKERAEAIAAGLERGKDREPGLCQGPHEVRRADDVPHEAHVVDN